MRIRPRRWSSCASHPASTRWWRRRWPSWRSARRCCPTASSFTPMTATPRWPRSPAWGTSPGPRSCAARRSRTCSCASPAAPLSTDPVPAVSGAGAPGKTKLFEHGPQLPQRRMATPMWLRAARYWGYQYRRTWRSSVVTSFLIPVLYLAAMGVALGSLIDKHSHGVGGVTYVAFLAPGLLAGTTMQIGTNDASYPVMGAIKWMRTYLAQLATPLNVYDVWLGHLAWMAARLSIVVSIYL